MSDGASGAALSKGWMAPVLVSLIGAFMSILDSSIVNVAIPTIMNVFNATTDSVEWVATIYMLALGVVIPLSGWLGDKLGYKRLYVLSLGVFMGGSLLCGLSWSLDSLIAARVIQAMGGGMIMPTTMAMVYRMVPRDKIGGGMGVFGVALLVAPALGPTIGGYFVEYVDWRWIFTVNLPIGVVGIALALLVLPEFQSRHPGKLDLGGALSSAVMLFCLLLALSKGHQWGWLDERIVLLLAVSFFAFVLFVYLELSSPNPLLELRVFKYPSFTFANLLMIATTVGMYAGTFYIPLFLQSVRGLGAMETGLLMMPGALFSGALMPITGKLFDKVGPRPLVIMGVLILSILTFQFRDLDLATATSTITLWVLLRGGVMAFATMPAQTAALVDVPTELVGKASAITNIISRVSSSFGLAVLTSLLSSREAFHQARYSWSLTASDPAVSSAVTAISSALGGGARGAAGALAWLQGQAAKLSFVRAVDDVFVAVAAFTVIALIPAVFLKRGKGGSPGAAAAE
jgi:EmrB/QacA subfamily drug resistance transporter